ncbi:hypothetical protein RIF29_25640 [Crotalaria pallida]|uniref:Ribonuclease H n=1 Tax=Crotalaria pallida TaxID=3830 RepID=A0AAN9EPA3_CROPI
MGRFYVVFEGLNPGVYRSWDECEQQIHGVSGNKHKSFSTEEEANEEFRKYQLKKKRCAQPQEEGGTSSSSTTKDTKCFNMDSLQDALNSIDKSKMEFADLLVYENDLLGASMESCEVQGQVAANQVQVDSESATMGFNAGNVFDADDALPSAVGDVVDGEKASVGDEARNVINNDPIHNDSDLNVMGGHSSPGIDFPPELTANFILQVSDEEGGSGHMNTMSTPNLKLGKLYGDSGAPRSSKRRQNAMPDELGSMGKRLFPSPTSNRQTPMQRPPRSGGGQSSKSSQIQSPAFVSKSNSVSNVSSQAKQNTRQRSVSIPRVMKTMFKAPGDINFNLSEAMMFAFIFGDDMDLCEPLVTMGDLRLWRLDFLNFVPGKEIKVTISSKYSNVSVQIFTVYAMKVALTQKYYSFVTTWHLAPSFAVDLKLGKNTSEMLEIYKDTWMHLSNDLRFIYVPIMEDDHWYLTVISMRDSTAYHCEALYKMMSSDEFGSSVEDDDEDEEAHVADMVQVFGG